jgi:hypothetical protein
LKDRFQRDDDVFTRPFYFDREYGDKKGDEQSLEEGEPYEDSKTHHPITLHGFDFAIKK